MAARDFFGDEARARTRATIEAIEARTCAEVVVAIRRRSGDPRAADLLAGALLAYASLLLLLFLPQPFTLPAIAVDVGLMFALGVLVSSSSGAIRRVLTPRRERERRVREGARAHFVESGCSVTSGRHGILVYVSVLERRAEVVADVGVEVDDAAFEAVRRSVEGADFQAFLHALEALGTVLAQKHPRREDDVNELSDEVAA